MAPNYRYIGCFALDNGEYSTQIGERLVVDARQSFVERIGLQVGTIAALHRYKYVAGVFQTNTTNDVFERGDEGIVGQP